MASSNTNHIAFPAKTRSTYSNDIFRDQYELLRERVKLLQRHGHRDQVDALQSKHPDLNLTFLYDFYSTGGRVYDDDDNNYYYHNGSYHLRPGYTDTEDGYWQNDTFHRSNGEAAEREDGYFINGTWYEDEREAEDNYMYNGTYGGEMEPPDIEDGFYHNKTFYNEEEKDEDENLMWWQLHHPKWKDGGANNVDTGKSLPSDNTLKQQQGISLKRLDEHRIPASSGHPRQQHRQQSHRHLAVPIALTKLPTVQHRLPVKQPIVRAHSQQTLPQSTKDLAKPQHQQSPTGRSGIPPQNAGNPGHEITNPAKAAMIGNEPIKEQVNNVVSRKLSATASWSIALAVIVGIAVVISPVACLVYKYRQERRIKKRTLLRRSEHGSVDDGIMDAMVMTDFGERSDSRVHHIGKSKGGRLQSCRYKPTMKSDLAHKSQSKSKYELRKPTSTTFVNIDDEHYVTVQ